MKKAILLLIVALVNTTLLFARGGSGPSVSLTDPSGSVNEVITETIGQLHTWMIRTDINSRIEISYTIHLSEGDIFMIKQHAGMDVALELVGEEGGSTFSDVFVTDVCDGIARVQLTRSQSSQADNAIINFSYQILPSMNNLSVTGKLGVGTMCPNYELDVDGTIRANEVIINIPNGADFVFEDGYELRSLEELSNYVQENKHLPEIAPAAEMEADGVSVNELQIKLLQKIEELTLYVIEQEKKIKELEKMINQ